jgi:predicted RNA polymerase sigma factor
MLYAQARQRARRSEQGEYVPLAAQDTALWDAGMIDEAEALLRRAGRFGRIGRYQLEAALQSAHVERRRTGRTDWTPEVKLYDALHALTGSPVVALNRALAMAERDGPHTALAIVDTLSADKRLLNYQPYWAARADLLARVGECEQAHHAYEIAIGLTRDASARRFLQARQADVLPKTAPSPAK